MDAACVLTNVHQSHAHPELTGGIGGACTEAGLGASQIWHLAAPVVFTYVQDPQVQPRGAGG